MTINWIRQFVKIKILYNKNNEYKVSIYSTMSIYVN